MKGYMKGVKWRYKTEDLFKWLRRETNIIEVTYTKGVKWSAKQKDWSIANTIEGTRRVASQKTAANNKTEWTHEGIETKGREWRVDEYRRISLNDNEGFRYSEGICEGFTWREKWLSNWNVGSRRVMNKKE